MASSKSLPVVKSAVTAYRLAFVIQRYFDFGGQQRDMLRIAQSCTARGHDVHIVTSDWKGQRPEGLTIHEVDARAMTNHGAVRRFGEAAGRFVAGHDFDCVVGFCRMPGLDVFWCGDPCQRALLGTTKPNYVRWLPRFATYLKLEEIVMRRGASAELLVLTPRERDHIARLYQTEPSRLHVLPPGIDRRRFSPAPSSSGARCAVRHELNLSEEEVVALLVGSSFDTKGVDRAILALASLPIEKRNNTSLVVVGNGKPEAYRRLASRMGVADRVHFTGGRHDMPDIYRAADLLVHPARMEAAGHTIVEALVSGLPVVVTKNCGYAFHIAAAGAGIVCPVPFAQQNLNRALHEAVDAERRREWQHSGAEYCRNTDLSSMVEESVAVILATAERNSRSRHLAVGA